MKHRILLGAAALSLLFISAPASAEVAVGADAPTFQSGDYVNTDPVQISDLKGRLILLELFSTT
jgi:hypothetical protein